LIVSDKVLDFKVIEEPLDKALEALKNLIDREWPERLKGIPGARALFLTMIKVAVNTYQSIRFLAADYPKESAPRLEFALSIPPLTRSLLDQLFSVIFLSEDLSVRTQWFYKSGWRETKETYDRYIGKYGESPEWVNWFSSYGGFLEKTRLLFLDPSDRSSMLARVRHRSPPPPCCLVPKIDAVAASCHAALPFPMYLFS